MQRLVLIDGHAILHRAYHALPPLTTSKGEVVNAVYGFTLMFLKAIQDLKPTYLVVAFDRPKPTFRKKLYKGYQAQRPEMEKELVSQIDLVHKLIREFGIPIYELDGYEADDVIGTLAIQAENDKGEKKEVVIVTGDKDMMQLVSDRIKLYMPVKGLSQAKLFDREGVVEKLGVKPEKVVDFKGLTGDPSDNYPGVSGIGPKTATLLLEKYGSVEEIYKNLDRIEGKTKEKLINGKEEALLSKKLATIIRDAPVNLELKKSKLASLDRPDVRQILEDLEFRSLIPRLSVEKTAGKSNKNKKLKKKKSKPDTGQTTLF